MNHSDKLESVCWTLINSDNERSLENDNHTRLIASAKQPVKISNSIITRGQIKQMNVEIRKRRRRRRRKRRKRIMLSMSVNESADKVKVGQKFLKILILSLISATCKMSTTVTGTSQISSVWLPTGEHQHQHHQQQLNSRWGDLSESTYPLQASSSSLQPTITSLDGIAQHSTDADHLAQAVNTAGGRPADYNPSTERPELLLPQQNSTNEASSQLDHQWTINNAGVHFDEEQQQQQNLIRRSNRRQDVNETSILNLPQRTNAQETSDDENSTLNLTTIAAYQRQLDSYDPTNRTSSLHDSHTSASSYNQSSADSNNQQSFIYYLPKAAATANAALATYHGENWLAPPRAQSVPSNDSTSSFIQIARHMNDNLQQIEKLNKSPSVSNSLDDTDVITTYAALGSSSSSSSSQHRQSNLQEVQPVSPPIQPTVVLTSWPQHFLQQQQQQQQQHQKNQMVNLERRATTATPHYLDESQFMSLQQPSFMQTYLQQQLFNPQRLSNSNNRFSSAGNFHNLNYNNNELPRREFRLQPGARRDTIARNPNRQGSVSMNYRSRDAPSLNKQRNPLLRPFVLKTSKQKPKKSLLGSLGNKINSWVDPEANRVQKLEENFWNDEQQRRNKWLKSNMASQWQKENFYLVDQPVAGMLSPSGYSTASLGVSGSAGLRPPVTQYVAQQGPDSTLTLYPPNFYGATGGIGMSDFFTPSGQAGMVHQPTVAPAPSSLERFYQPHRQPIALGNRRSPVYPNEPHMIHQSSSHHLSQFVHPKIPAHDRVNSQPASFVPVVAVSVTKTSPAPTKSLPDNSFTDEQQPSPAPEAGNQAELNSELLDYLDLKTANRAHQSQRTFDDYGNLAAGSVSRDLASRQTPSMQQQVNAQLNGEQTTTVKSAVFGYFPQDAQKPILEAINMLPSTAAYPLHSQRHQPLLALRQHQQQAAIHGGQHLASASDAFVHQVEQVDPQQVVDTNPLIHEEAPSLLLQLQANHFAQNDIAHPFSSPYTPSRSAYKTHMRAYPTRPVPTTLRTIDVYPTNQAQFHGFHLVDPGLDSAQAALSNPLLSAGDARSAQMLTSASDLLPSGHSHLFYATTANGNALGSHDQHQQQMAASVSSVTAAPEGSSEENQDDSDESHQVSKQDGKKRSSEFFASAGQLLLSALPLLLAPTLGLMFASAPLPVARYQAPLNQQTFTGSGGSVHSSLPGNYINSLNTDGQVSVGSAAHLFTPNPPGYSTSTSRPALVRPVGSRVQVQSAAPQLPPAPPTSSPALISARNRTLTAGTPNPQRLSVTVTTLGPTTPLDSILHESIDENPVLISSNSKSNHSTGGGEQHLHHHHHHVGNTILLLANDPDSVHHQSVDSSNETHRVLTGSQYDVAGYDGVDFDAQFASVRQHDRDRNATYELTSNELMMEASQSQNRNHDHNHRNRNPDRNQVSDSTSSRLFPVSTWPPMRRRTVSLVTSNGNKTFSDASDKYVSVGQDYFARRNDTSSIQVFQNDQLNNSANRNSTLYYRGNNQTSMLPPVIETISELLLRDDAEQRARPRTVRKRRSVDTPSSNSTGLVRPVRIRRRRVVRKNRPRTEGESTYDETGVDPLKQDASKNKAAHIITTIVAQDDLDDEKSSGDVSRSRTVDEDSLLEDDNVADMKLRELLLKRKILLEKIEKNSNQIHQDLNPPVDTTLPAPVGNGESEPTDLGGNLSSFGRGRFPASPTPIEVTSTKIRMYTNGSADVSNFRPQNLKKIRPLKGNKNQLVLNEDTKRALMNFGSLLIKDTLQIPEKTRSGEYQSGQRSIPKRKQQQNIKQNNIKSGRAPAEADLWTIVNPSGGDLLDVATERSVSSSYSSPSSDHPDNSYNSNFDSNSDEENEDLIRHPVPASSLRLRPRSKPAHDYHSRGSSSYRVQSDRANLIDSESPYNFGSDERSDRYMPAGHSYASEQEASTRSRFDQSHPSRPSREFNYSERRTEPGPTNVLGLESPQINQQQQNYIYDLMMRHYPGNHHTNTNFSPGGDPPSVSSPTPYPYHSHQMHQQQQQFPGGLGGPNAGYNVTTYAPNLYVPNHLNQHSNRPHSYSRPELDYQNQNGFNPYSSPLSPPSLQQHQPQPLPLPSLPLPPSPPTLAPTLPPPTLPPTTIPYQQNFGPRLPQNLYGQSNDAYQREYYSPTRYPTYQRNFYQTEPSNYSTPQQPFVYQSTINGLIPGSSAASATSNLLHQGGPLAVMSASQQEKNGDPHSVNDYLKRVQFNDSDRDKLMASYLTCDGLLNDSDHCLERLACEFSDPQNIVQANKLDRAVSSILLGHILINTYIPNNFKYRLKSASLYGYTQSGKCSRYACNKLSRPPNYSTNSIPS